MLSPFTVICAFRESSSVIDALDLSFDDYSNDPTANYYWRRRLTRYYNSIHSVLSRLALVSMATTPLVEVEFGVAFFGVERALTVVISSVSFIIFCHHN